MAEAAPPESHQADGIAREPRHGGGREERLRGGLRALRPYRGEEEAGERNAKASFVSIGSAQKDQRGPFHPDRGQHGMNTSEQMFG